VKEKRVAPVLGLVWIGLIVAAAALTGCRRFSVLYAVFLAVSLGVAVGALLLMKAVYRDGVPAFFPALRKFTGYAVVALYIAHSFPRVEWENAGLITDAHAAFLYLLTLICTAAGIAFFVSVARDRSSPRVDRKAAKSARRNPVVWLLEWVDALAFAAVAVLLVETFVFQIYQVPTESMVPVFLSGDRPLTVKLAAGPRLPLTDWRFPFLKRPARGDVVTIANPRYAENSGVSLKKYLSQVVSMITFTLVNIDKTTPDGSPKADPLVKRIVGVPGEKLMMVDDVLYARTASQPDFRPVSVDTGRFAQVDLWKLPPQYRARVSVIPVDERTRGMLARWDARKNEAEPVALAAALLQELNRFRAHCAALPRPVLDAFVEKELPRAGQDAGQLFLAALEFRPAGAANPIARMGARSDDFSLALAAARSPSTSAALAEYAAAGMPQSTAAAGAGKAALSAYARGSYNLDLLIKTNLLQRMDRDLVVVAGGASLEAIVADGERNRLVQDARELSVYLERFYDERNFPEFPSGGAFLGRDQFFAMGDNRYNSLDFRFSERYRPRALSASDPSSVQYPSLLAPFPLEQRFIEGYAIFRVWPLGRMGVIR
jgi:signal peptidase I